MNKKVIFRFPWFLSLCHVRFLDFLCMSSLILSSQSNRLFCSCLRPGNCVAVGNHHIQKTMQARSTQPQRPAIDKNCFSVLGWKPVFKNMKRKHEHNWHSWIFILPTCFSTRLNTTCSTVNTSCSDQSQALIGDDKPAKNPSKYPRICGRFPIWICLNFYNGIQICKYTAYRYYIITSPTSTASRWSSDWAADRWSTTMLWMTGCACAAAMQKKTPRLFWEVIVDLQLVETSIRILYHIIVILYLYIYRIHS